jgi:hypothetical protein
MTAGATPHHVVVAVESPLVRDLLVHVLAARYPALAVTVTTTRHAAERPSGGEIVVVDEQRLGLERLLTRIARALEA